MKDFEKWRTTTAGSPSGTKHPVPEDIEKTDDGVQVIKAEACRPTGNKKKKMLEAIELEANQWMETIADSSQASKENNDAMLHIMEQNMQQSKNNVESLERVLEVQTQKITSEMKKTTALKVLVKLDLKTMSQKFQKKLKRRLKRRLALS